MMCEAQRRLLDMLAGWEMFVESCNDAAIESHPGVTKEELETETEAIAALYQEVGARDLNSAEVAFFVLNKVLPLLWKGRR